MRTLLILRHAKSSWAVTGQRDFDRPLSERGEEQVERLRPFLSEQDIRPDAVLCSPAARTRATLQGILPVLHEPAVAYEETLYNGSITSYLTAIAVQEGATVLVVGHNPTCDELTRQLAAPSSPAAERMNGSHFATATLARLRFDADDWTHLRDGSGQLDLFVTPKSLVKG